MAMHVKTVVYTSIPLVVAGMAAWAARSKTRPSTTYGRKAGKKLDSITSEATKDLRKAVSQLQAQAGARKGRKLGKQLDRTVNEASRNIGKAIDHVQKNVQKQIKNLGRNGQRLKTAER